MYRRYKKNEFYTRKAHEEGYPARSVYKLQEIDERYGVIRKGDKVLDLGSAPGSWLKYIAEKVGKGGRVVGIDEQDLGILLPSNTVFINKNILLAEIISLPLLKEKYNVVVADLAPKTSGVDYLDVARSLELSEKSLEIAKMTLKKGGNFVCKIFEGEGPAEFTKNASLYFRRLKKFKPKAVRKESREIYIVGKGFNGAQANP